MHSCSQKITCGIMAPRSRKCLTLDIKVDVICCKEMGQKNCNICHALGLAESTVRMILIEKELYSEVC